MDLSKEFVPSADLEHKRQTAQSGIFYESFIRAIVLLSPHDFPMSQNDAAEIYKQFNTSWSGEHVVSVFQGQDMEFLKSEFARTHSPFLAVVQLAGLLVPGEMAPV